MGRRLARRHDEGSPAAGSCSHTMAQISCGRWARLQHSYLGLRFPDRLRNALPLIEGVPPWRTLQASSQSCSIPCAIPASVSWHCGRRTRLSHHRPRLGPGEETASRGQREDHRGRARHREPRHRRHEGHDAVVPQPDRCRLRLPTASPGSRRQAGREVLLRAGQSRIVRRLQGLPRLPRGDRSQGYRRPDHHGSRPLARDRRHAGARCRQGPLLREATGADDRRERSHPRRGREIKRVFQTGTQQRSDASSARPACWPGAGTWARFTPSRSPYPPGATSSSSRRPLCPTASTTTCGPALPRCTLST